MFVARPVSVFISTLGSDLDFKEKLLIAWIGPRGIVAAAVASLFSFRLGEAGYLDAVFRVPLTFLIIIGTVVIQGATSKSFAKLLQAGNRHQPACLLLAQGMSHMP